MMLAQVEVSVQTLLISGITALAAVVTFLFKIWVVDIRTQLREAKEHHLDCEKQRDEQTLKIDHIRDEHATAISVLQTEIKNIYRKLAKLDETNGH